MSNGCVAVMAVRGSCSCRGLARSSGLLLQGAEYSGARSRVIEKSTSASISTWPQFKLTRRQF